MTEKVAEYPLPIIGTSEAINRARCLAWSAAQHDINVLLLGESGVGKELFAKTIHLLSPRKDQPFIALNCSAMPETLLESELFGYERGAFTGAHTAKIGRLEMANSGTLFLDEIGEMSVLAQCKLFRVLENEKKFERLGGTRSITVDVRIIAATNADLEKKIAEKVFRSELFYRLKEFSITIPPLRERKDDIRQLADYYLGRSCQRFGKSKPGISPGLLAALIDYPWFGNVRELQNAITQALVSRNGKSADLDLNDFSHLDISPPSYEFQSLAEAEKKLVLKTLAVTKYTNGRWNKTKAARCLGADVKTIYNKLRAWGIKEPVAE